MHVMSAGGSPRETSVTDACPNCRGHRKTSRSENCFEWGCVPRPCMGCRGTMSRTRCSMSRRGRCTGRSTSNAHHSGASDGNSCDSAGVCAWAVNRCTQRQRTFDKTTIGIDTHGIAWLSDFGHHTRLIDLEGIEDLYFVPGRTNTGHHDRVRAFCKPSRQCGFEVNFTVGINICNANDHGI